MTKEWHYTREGGHDGNHSPPSSGQVEGSRMWRSCDEEGGCEAIIDETLFPGMQRELSELENGQGTQDAQRVMALGAQFAIILTKTGEKFRDSPYYGLFQRYTALQEKI